MVATSRALVAKAGPLCLYDDLTFEITDGKNGDLTRIGYNLLHRLVTEGRDGSIVAFKRDKSGTIQAQITRLQQKLGTTIVVSVYGSGYVLKEEFCSSLAIRGNACNLTLKVPTEGEPHSVQITFDPGNDRITATFNTRLRETQIHTLTIKKTTRDGFFMAANGTEPVIKIRIRPLGTILYETPNNKHLEVNPKNTRIIRVDGKRIILPAAEGQLLAALLDEERAPRTLSNIFFNTRSPNRTLNVCVSRLRDAGVHVITVRRSHHAGPGYKLPDDFRNQEKNRQLTLDLSETNHTWEIPTSVLQGRTIDVSYEDVRAGPVLTCSPA